jgi:hypothetical protein
MTGHLIASLDYSGFGFPASPEKYVSSDEQRRRLKRSYEKKREWMDQRGLCVWTGEWGPVYARAQYDGGATDAINERRYQVLKDQLGIYNQASRTHLRISQSLTVSIHAGPPELVDLAVQRHWLPGHDLRLARNQVHHPPQRFSRQETPSCGGDEDYSTTSTREVYNKVSKRNDTARTFP